MCTRILWNDNGVATVVARTMDSDRKHLTETLKAAAAHRGTSLVEIYQNCPIFNDGAFELLKDRDEATARILHLVPGEPVRAGAGYDTRVVVHADNGSLEVVAEKDAPADRIVRHDPTDLGLAFALSRLDDPSFKHVPMGIFRQVDAPTYDDGVRAQIEQATGGEQVADAELQQLLDGSDTWDVQARD